jgi:hypothetical protein
VVGAIVGALTMFAVYVGFLGAFSNALRDFFR